MMIADMTGGPIQGDADGDDARWAAIVARDRDQDGRFYMSVATTGVYCRPGCPARLPNRENVRFHATREDAERAGFRPCRRCKPDEPPLGERYAAKVAAACRRIETAERPPSLAELAREAGFSPHHFHRVFKAVAGVTPKDYALARRRERVGRSLASSASVTEAIYDAGYESNGRFYAESNGMLGMTPSRFRGGGAGETIRFAVAECSLGSVLVAATAKGVCAILLGDGPDVLIHALERRFPGAELTGGDATFAETVARVASFVDDPGKGFDLPLDVRGTAFQQRVWRALRAIPAGSTATYSEIAARIGSPQAVRAVAGACAANPVAVAIPCHRVLGADGSLSGYRWGVERKRALLRKEGSKK